MARISRATFAPPARGDVIKNKPLADLLDITFDTNTKGKEFFGVVRNGFDGTPQRPLQITEIGLDPPYKLLYEFWARIPQFAGYDMSGRFDDDPLPFHGRIMASGDVTGWKFGVGFFEPATGDMVHLEEWRDGSGLTGGPTQDKGLFWVSGAVPKEHSDKLLRVQLVAAPLGGFPQPITRTFTAALFWWEDSEEVTYPELPDFAPKRTLYNYQGVYATRAGAFQPNKFRDSEDDEERFGLLPYQASIFEP